MCLGYLVYQIIVDHYKLVNRLKYTIINTDPGVFRIDRYGRVTLTKKPLVRIFLTRF